jgi:prefoldin subunit 5
MAPSAPLPRSAAPGGDEMQELKSLLHEMHSELKELRSSVQDLRDELRELQTR